MVLSRSRRRVVVVAAVAVTLALALAVAIARPGPASAASGDPNPPYVSKSQPGGYELYGIHRKQTGATTTAWLGLQRNHQGLYRWWAKAQGDGRPVVALFDEVVLTASPNRWGPTSAATRSAPTVYAVGKWHRIEDLATVQAQVHISYATGRSTGWRCLDSYVIRRGQRAAFSGPRPGC